MKFVSTYILLLLANINHTACLLVGDSNASFIIPYNFSIALRDIAKGLNCKSLVIYDQSLNSSKYDFLDSKLLISSLHNEGVASIYFDNTMNSSNKQKYMTYLSKGTNNTMEITSLIFCKPEDCENLLNEIKANDFIHRFMLYIFYWGTREASGRFLSGLHEALRVVVITNPKPGTFRIYYNQGLLKDSSHPLPLVNWWTDGKLYQTPTLPIPLEVYSNMRGRVFRVPVLHAPPWYYVNLVNKSSIEVSGGRDHQLLSLLANKLNFRYRYFDPPHHSQGSGVTANGSFAGVLGMIYRREADFFLGDVSISWERQRGIEFSFLTLADSGTFITHARRRHSGALELLRPFDWQVWPIIIMTVILSGPVLWISATQPSSVKKNGKNKQPTFGCTPPSDNVRSRAVTLLLSFGATYVISDLYSGMLTSLMARPTLEPPMSTLTALEKAMVTRGYHLLVERHSSSLAILQNGTGVYGRLWKIMSQQPERTVKSVEQGARRLLQHHGPPVAILAGRETLFFNTKKFGTTNFQLSKKLYTRYSAIAMQIGCPYIENFNRVLMHLFEAGILDKMTSQEYERFKGDVENDEMTTSNIGSGEMKENIENTMTTSNAVERLESVSMRMLQGAFYILFFGYTISAFTLLVEVKVINYKWDMKQFGRNIKKPFTITFNSIKISYKYIKAKLSC